LQNNTFSSLRSYPELEAVRNDLGWTVAHDSIISGDIVLLSHQLQLNPRLGQLTDCGGATALHWAASFANMEAISTLLNAGADVNAICKYGDSVLFWALYSGSVSCCEAIIDAGADVQLTNIEGDNVLMRCVSMSEPIEEILSLFLYLGVNLEAHDVDGATALMLASTYATSRVCTMLLDKGANVDTRDVFGHSAVWAATFSNRHSNLQLLVHRGASLNCLDEDGDSIIVGAALYADINTMEILKEARIEGLPMDPGSVGDYWDWFDARDKFFLGHRAPLEEEEEAFQALLDSIIPCPDPPPPTVVKSLDIPGAYPIDSTDDLGLATNSRIEEPADESDTGN
jgi:ankyrin repeat protein